MPILLILLAILVYVLYFLFIRGNIWIMLFCPFCVYGGYAFLLKYIPSSHITVMTFLQYEISWAMFCSVAVMVLGSVFLAHKFKERDD
jgi:hypothetical protein